MTLAIQDNLENSSQAQSILCKASLLRCPSCQSIDMSNSGTHIHCQNCNIDYPFIGNKENKIPFLFANKNSAWQGWVARLNGFNKQLLEKNLLLEKSLSDKKNSKLSIARIKKIIRANQIYKAQVEELLVDFGQGDFEHNMNANKSLAKNQGVDSYINNIFRDWCWNNGENKEMLSALNSVVPEKIFSAGKVLGLGSGASRLLVDFQQQHNIDHCVLLDINPLLLNIANNIIHGEEVDLIEFPTAPTSMNDYAVMQTCKLPDEYKADEQGDFEFILADATNIPFADKAFNTIVTPWLIDILPINFRDFIPHINRLLPVGGYWLNTGSLAFFYHNDVLNYSQEEVLDLLKKYGFEVVSSNRQNINYLHSPHSAHGRIESVFNFCVRKKHDCVPPNSFEYFPDWINDTSAIIPKSEELFVSSSKHLLQAQILSAIDGVRSSDDIAMLIAKEYDMPLPSASAAVRQILIDNYI